MKHGVFEQSERMQGPIYTVVANKLLMIQYNLDLFVSLFSVHSYSNSVKRSLWEKNTIRPFQQSL